MYKNNVIKLPKPVSKSPGIDLSRWNTSYEIAEDLLVTMQHIRSLYKILRMYDKELAEAIDLNKKMKHIIDDQIDVIKFYSDYIEVLKGSY